MNYSYCYATVFLMDAGRSILLCCYVDKHCADRPDEFTVALCVCLVTVFYMSAARTVVADVRGMNRAQAVSMSRRCTQPTGCLSAYRKAERARGGAEKQEKHTRALPCVRRG